MALLFQNIEAQALEAANKVRRDWLRDLEIKLGSLFITQRAQRAEIQHAIRMLRRKLGILQSDEERRAKIRERVARFRKRQGRSRKRD